MLYFNEDVSISFKLIFVIKKTFFFQKRPRLFLCEFSRDLFHNTGHFRDRLYNLNKTCNVCYQRYFMLRAYPTQPYCLLSLIGSSAVLRFTYRSLFLLHNLLFLTCYLNILSHDYHHLILTL